VWFLDSCAYHHIKKSWEIFIILVNTDLDVHVHVGHDSKYAMKEDGTFTFQIDLVGLLDA
jgi:hypothetical protein